MMTPYNQDEVFSPLDHSFRPSENGESQESEGVIVLEDTPRQLSPGKSSILGASFNYINSIIGAGIIGTPYAIYECGFFTGVIVLALVAYLNYRSVIMLVECGLISNKLDLEELTYFHLGEAGYYAALSMMFLFAFGGQVAYMVIIGDTIPAVTQQFISASDTSELFLIDRRIVTAIIAVVIMLPLCLMRNLSSLSWFSLFSIMSDFAITFITVSCAPSISRSQGTSFTPARLTLFNTNVFAGIGAMSFSFVCQHNSFLVFRSLQRPTNANWKSVALISISFSFFLVLIFGVSGYLNFGSDVKGDLLRNFPDTYPPVSAARLMLAICMTCTYPLENYVAKHCIFSMYTRYKRYSAQKSQINSASIASSFLTMIVQSLALVGVLFDWRAYSLAENSNHTRPAERSSHDRVIEIVSRGRMPLTQDDDDQGDEDLLTIHFNGADSPSNHGGFDDKSSHDIKDHHEQSGAPEVSTTPTLVEHVVITTAVWLITTSLAIFSSDLSIVLALTGAVAASMLGYILPGLVYIQTYKQEFTVAVQSLMDPLNSVTVMWLRMRKFALPMFMVVFGALCMVIGVATVFATHT